jgi:hypothetical protein
MNKTQIKPLLSTKSFNDGISFQKNLTHSMEYFNKQTTNFSPFKPIIQNIQNDNLSHRTFFLSSSMILNIIMLLMVALILSVLYYRYKNKIDKSNAINYFLENASKIDEQIKIENHHQIQTEETIKQQQKEEHEQKIAEQIELKYNKRPANTTDDIIDSIINNNRANNNNMDKYDNHLYRDYLKTNNLDINKKNPIFEANKPPDMFTTNSKLNQQNNNGVVNNDGNRLVNMNQAYNPIFQQ